MKVEKPWGHEIRWALNEKYIGKILRIEPGQKLSRLIVLSSGWAANSTSLEQANI